MYQMDARVRYSEVDETHRIKLESVLDYFQDCCTFHSEDVGGGLEFLKGQKRAWLLASWQIVIKEYPKLGEMCIRDRIQYILAQNNIPIADSIYGENVSIQVVVPAQQQ